MMTCTALSPAARADSRIWPPIMQGSMPCVTAFSTSGWISMGGISTFASSRGRSMSNESRWPKRMPWMSR
ncbi:hypothetical protein D3C72_2397130 [compost metagenome]